MTVTGSSRAAAKRLQALDEPALRAAADRATSRRAASP
jgi:hypothetical protein